MERLRNISPDTIREELLVQEVGLLLSALTDNKPTLLLFLLSDTSYESLCPVVPGMVIFTSSVCVSHPRVTRHPDYHPPRVRGAHREGVQHPGEEVEGVQRRADAPARPAPSRHEGHLWVQAPCRLHQLWWQLFFPGEPSPSTGTPQVLFQPPLTPWLPQVQGSFPLPNQEGFLLGAIRNRRPAASVATCRDIEPGARTQPQTAHSSRGRPEGPRTPHPEPLGWSWNWVSGWNRPGLRRQLGPACCRRSDS